jgi:hypothetical protein
MKLPKPRDAQHAKLITVRDVSFAITHDTQDACTVTEASECVNGKPHFNGDADFAIPAWRRHAHLCTPMIASIFAISFSPAIAHAHALGFGSHPNMLPFVASFAIPTYLTASFIYPTIRPKPTREQSIRFTRKETTSTAQA